MAVFKNIKIAVKLPFIMVSLSALALTIMGFVTHNSATATLEAFGRDSLRSTLETRSNALETWLYSIRSDVILHSSSPHVRSAVVELIGVWEALPGDKTSYLRDHYLLDDPLVENAFESRDYIKDRSDYSRAHRRYHPYFQALSNLKNYRDVFLLDANGNVLYSLLKSSEFGRNVATDQRVSPGLSAAFGAVVANEDKEMSFVDNAPFEKPNDAPSVFLASSVRASNGAILGVLAIHIPLQGMNGLFQTITPATQTLTTTVVNSDFRLRNGVTGSGETFGEYRSEPNSLALSGRAGIVQSVNNAGEDVLAAYAPIKFENVTWSMITQQTMEEIFSTTTDLQESLVLNGLLAMAAMGAFGIFLARSVSHPLAHVGKAMEHVAGANYAFSIPETDREDEIGRIAKTLEVLRNRLRIAKEKTAEGIFRGAAFDATSANLMMVDSDFVVYAVNASFKAMLDLNHEGFLAYNPKFDAEAVIGKEIDFLYKFPEHLREVLSDPTALPHHMDIGVGGCRFSVIVNPIIDLHENHIGSVIEWKDTTVERMNNAVLSSIDTGLARAVFSTEGILLGSNTNFARMTGHSLDALIGTEITNIINFNAELAEELGEVLDRVRNGETINGRFHICSRSGGDQLIEGNFTPVLSGASQTMEVLLIGTDITIASRSLREAETKRTVMEHSKNQIVEALRIGLKRLSEGNLTAKIQEEFPTEYEQLRTDFNFALDKLRDAMICVVENTEKIRGEANEISSAADDLSRRTERQAATLEETAVALDQLTSSVKSAAEGASITNQVVSEAKANAEKSGVVVQEAVTAMSQIEKSSAAIAKIVSVIEDIAFQTNLLSLNAGVEAARAGEAGRGFAVVASEVRALAQRSSEAAREINDLILSSGQHVKQGVNLVGATGDALNKIVASVSDISKHVSEISKSSQEQSFGLVEINTAVTNLDQVTQQNAAMFEHTTTACYSLTREAEILSETTSRFRTTNGTALADTKSGSGSESPPLTKSRGRNLNIQKNDARAPDGDKINLGTKRSGEFFGTPIFKDVI